MVLPTWHWLLVTLFPEVPSAPQAWPDPVPCPIPLAPPPTHLNSPFNARQLEPPVVGNLSSGLLTLQHLHQGFTLISNRSSQTSPMQPLSSHFTPQNQGSEKFSHLPPETGDLYGPARHQCSSHPNCWSCIFISSPVSRQRFL